MVIFYGWTYANHNTAIGWDKTEASYLLWENFWSRKIDAYIFTNAGTSPRLTDANEILDVGDIVNEMMVLMNLYLKASSTSSPLDTGLYDAVGFPDFMGDPDANNGLGTEHYSTLNKYKRKHSETTVRVDSIRHGVKPETNPFPTGMRFY